MKTHTLPFSTIFTSALMFISFSAVVGTAVQAQSDSDYAALLELLGTEKYQHLTAERPHALPNIAYANRHGWYLANTDSKDFSDYPSFTVIQPVMPNHGPVSVTELENGKWNMVAYSISPDEKDYQYYRLNDSGKILVILPSSLLRKKMLQDHE